MTAGSRRVAAGLLAAAQVPTAASLAYLLTLLAAARRRTPPPPAPGTPRVTVLIPAHDEGAGVRATVASVRALDWPAERLDVVVIADNCTDDTAAQAAAAGARVLERDAPDARGKGRALAWAVERLAAAGPPPDAVVVVDADCTVEPGLLRAFAAHWAAGAEAVQARYLVANPAAAPAAAARAAAFALAADVRPLGKDRLGLSCGLLGTGMGFTWAHLQRHPWSSFGLTEDVERHLALVLAGERVVLASETAVHSAMPESLDGATSQQSRWEAGKLTLVRRWTPRLLAAGARERDPVRVHAGLELVVPPQSMLALSAAAGAALGTLARLRGPRRLALACAAAQAAFVAGGMLRMRAPAAAWRGLALAPALALRKAAVVGRIADRPRPERLGADGPRPQDAGLTPPRQGHAPGMPGSLSSAALDRLRDVPRAAQRALRARRPVTAAELTWRVEAPPGRPRHPRRRRPRPPRPAGPRHRRELGPVHRPPGQARGADRPRRGVRAAPRPRRDAARGRRAAPAVDVHMTALSDHEGQAELVIPVHEGEPLTALAHLDAPAPPRRASGVCPCRCGTLDAVLGDDHAAGRPRQVRRRGP